MPTNRVYVIKQAYVLVLLDRKGRNQTWLAQRIGMSTSYLCRAMKGHKTISGEMTRRILKVFGGEEWDNIFKVRE